MSYEHHKQAVIRKSQKKYYAMERAIDVIIEHPEKTRKEQAEIMGISTTALSTILKNPDFEALRSERMAQIIDPILRERLEHGLLKTSLKAIEVVEDKLTVEPTLHDALSTLKVTTNALGMANRKEAVKIDNNIQIAWLPTQP